MDELRALSGTDFGTLRGTSSNSRTSYPSNIDGIDERNGHFLFYEIKQLNEQTSEGQQRMLEALAKMPKTTAHSRSYRASRCAAMANSIWRQLHCQPVPARYPGVL